MRRSFLRAGMWVCALAVVAVAAGLVVGMVKPGHQSKGNYAFGLSGNRLEVAWGAGTVTKSQYGWMISNAVGMADSIMTPKSAWLPSVVGSGMGSVAGGPGPMLEVTAVDVPLWPVLVLVGGMMGGLWWWAGPKVKPGHCRCGYDLQGLSGERCPECGAAMGTMVQRVVSRLVAVGAAVRARRVCPSNGHVTC